MCRRNQCGTLPQKASSIQDDCHVPLPSNLPVRRLPGRLYQICGAKNVCMPDSHSAEVVLRASVSDRRAGIPAANAWGTQTRKPPELNPAAGKIDLRLVQPLIEYLRW